MITGYDSYFTGGDDTDGGDDKVNSEYGYTDGWGESAGGANSGSSLAGSFMEGWFKLSLVPLLVFSIFLFIFSGFLYMITLHKAGMFFGFVSIVLGAGVGYMIIKG